MNVDARMGRRAPRFRFALALLPLLGAAWTAPERAGAAPDSPGTSTISAAQMKDYLAYVASDEMEGRATPSRGLDATAKFIATLLSRWGLRPGGDDGTFFQKIAMSSSRVVPQETSASVNGRTLKYGEEFLGRANSGSGSAAGSLVYAGDGWMVKASGQDAFRGLEVRGKIVIVNLPEPRRQAGNFQGKAGEDWLDPASYAKQRGAAGIVFLAGESANWAAQRRMGEQARFVVDRFPENAVPEVPGLPAIVLNASVANSLFAGEKAEAADIFRSISDGKPLAGFDMKPEKQISFTTSVLNMKATSQNVVGILDGSDRNLKSEYIGLSAHYDHLGVLDTPVNGDRVYNGADDDGSGTVAVLSIAEAASHAPRRPKRSLLFVWHMGEERGLWGSRYFTMFPTVPLNQVDAFINIDMIGRSRRDGDTTPANRELTGPNEIYVIGATMMSTELDTLTRQVNDRYLKLNYNFKYDDPKDPNRFFFRSDHVNYARQGIPILFFFDGVHEDYHRLSDEVSKIDFDKMERVTRTIYQTLWQLASLRDRPKVDKPTPPQLQR